MHDQLAHRIIISQSEILEELILILIIIKYVYHFLSFFYIKDRFFRILRNQKRKYFNRLDRLKLYVKIPEIELFNQ